MNTGLHNLAKTSVKVLKAVAIYYSVFYFFGVGLASMIVLTRINPSTDSCEIGLMVGSFTLFLPIMWGVWYLLDGLLKDLDKKVKARK
jgi:hypothetical protein